MARPASSPRCSLSRSPSRCFRFPPPANAKSASELKAELEQLKTETREAGNAFDRAYWQLDETEVRIDKTDKKIAVTKKQLAKAKGRLSLHAASIYRRGDYSLFEFMMGAATFDEFVTRMDYLRRIGASDAAGGCRREGAARPAQLAAGGARQGAQVGAAGARLSAVPARPAAGAAQGEAGRLPAGEGAARRASRRTESPGWPDGSTRSERDGLPGRRARTTTPTRGAHRAAVAGGGIRAPTSWRRGARRSSRSSRAACAPATTASAASASGSAAGNGWQFYYAHLDGWAVRSGRVRAGQVIGYVGSTGNAAGGAPHLHLQIHPRGGCPVNPYPYLRAME